MKPEDCLPTHLQGPSTTLSRIAAGLSGAGVYRVESGGRSYVLKIASQTESEADWRQALEVQRLAAGAGLAPRVVHADEARRAVLTDFVADRSFMAFYFDPRSREAALDLLGRTVARIHALPIPADLRPRDPREYLTHLWGGPLAGYALPAFAGDAIRRVLAEVPPESGRAPVLSHNDLNPSNLVYDGQAIVLLDWAAAGSMDASYDLAVISVFMRMDPPTCQRLLSAYEGRPADQLPERFLFSRRLAAAFAGALSLHLARQLGHPGALPGQASEEALPLGEFYQRMRAGALKLGTAEGQWAFGLALVKESLAL
jgi:aminoglycoside phosphotransferase (APT) family kinase protein